MLDEVFLLDIVVPLFSCFVLCEEDDMPVQFDLGRGVGGKWEERIGAGGRWGMA